MRHNDVHRLAKDIGEECQDAAELAGRIESEVNDRELYPTVELWTEAVQDLVDELVATLDILKDNCSTTLVVIDKAARDVE